MKKLLTKILSIALVFVMIMCLVPPVEASAASKKPYFPPSISMSYYPKAGKSANRISWGISDENGDDLVGKITNLKSSNKKVVTVYKSTWGLGIAMEAKKAGTTTITFNTKIGTKTYSHRCKITVTNYQSPIKTLKIGKKNYASQLSDINYIDLDGVKNLKGKLSVAMNKNWKINNMYIWDSKTDKSKKAKNNKSIELKKNQSLWISCYNKKTSEYIDIQLSNYVWY